MLYLFQVVFKLLPWSWTPAGGGQEHWSLQKNPPISFRYMGPFCYLLSIVTFSPHSLGAFFNIWGLFCYVFLLMGGLFHHGGPFAAFLSVCGVFFVLVRTCFRLAPPPPYENICGSHVHDVFNFPQVLLNYLQVSFKVFSKFLRLLIKLLLSSMSTHNLLLLTIVRCSRGLFCGHAIASKCQ